jgi:hypothetical protein
MVKGNWERRAEMAAARRIENKELKKCSKDRKKVATGEVARAKLLHMPVDTDTIVVWCVSPSAKIVCSDWLRADNCKLKKCKLNHQGSSLAHIRDIYCGDIPEKRIEYMCDPPVKLATLPARDANNIHFIAMGDRCIFDHLCPEVWNNFVFEFASSAATAAAAVTTHTATLRDVEAKYTSIVPGVNVQNIHAKAGSSNSLGIWSCPVAAAEAEAEDVYSGRHRCNGMDAHIPTKTTTHEINLLGSASMISIGWNTDIFAENWRCIIALLLPFLDAVAMMHMSMCSKGLRKFSLGHDMFRQRRKELFASVAGEYSKHKKAEQKKKLRQANAKVVSKKDGFARGGNGHR